MSFVSLPKKLRLRAGKRLARQWQLRPRRRASARGSDAGRANKPAALEKVAHGVGPLREEGKDLADHSLLLILILRARRLRRVGGGGRGRPAPRARAKAETAALPAPALRCAAASGHAAPPRTSFS